MQRYHLIQTADPFNIRKIGEIDFPDTAPWPNKPTKEMILTALLLRGNIIGTVEDIRDAYTVEYDRPCKAFDVWLDGAWTPDGQSSHRFRLVPAQ